MTVNDGNGLYDAAGLCEQLITILNAIEVKGAPNIQKMMLVFSGLQTLQDNLRKQPKEERNDENHPADEDS